MRLLSLVFGILISAIALRAQADALTCAEVFGDGMPEIIARSASVAADFELAAAGQSARGGQALAHLTDGLYVYLVDDRGRVFYSIETPFIGEEFARGHHFASHRSLSNEYARLTGNLPRVRAAGEFHVVNGRVSEVNNRASTYPAGEQNLKYASSRLGAYGLRVEPKTAMVDYSSQFEKSVQRHVDNRKKSELTARYGDTPEFKMIADLYRRLAERYPDPNTPGFMNESMISNRLGFLIREAGKERDLLMVEYFIVSHLQRDGIPLIVHRYYAASGDARWDLKGAVEALEQTFGVGV